MASFYENGNIYAHLYDADELPSDAELTQDLRLALEAYEVLSYNETVPSAVTGAEEDERGDEFIEDLRRLRQHKRIERNRKLAAQAKRAHGTECQVCRFDFVTVYGPVGDGYIEAHHLTPLAGLKGQRLRLDPRRDFAVLCANCHRMVHKSALPHDLEAFRAAHYRTSGLRRVAERSPGYNES